MLRRWLAALAALFLVACTVLRPAHDPEPAFARAGFVHMGIAVTSAAKQCTHHAQWLANGGGHFDFGAAARATQLSETCIRRLIPPRDALAFGIDEIDPWTPKSAATFGCTGKSVRVGLEALRGDFVMFGVRVPETMADGERIGRWAEQWASPDCDPLHPTTTITVIGMPNAVPTEPDPQTN